MTMEWKCRGNQVMPDKEYQNLTITTVFFTPTACQGKKVATQSHFYMQTAPDMHRHHIQYSQMKQDFILGLAKTCFNRRDGERT